MTYEPVKVLHGSCCVPLQQFCVASLVKALSLCQSVYSITVHDIQNFTLLTQADHCLNVVYQQVPTDTIKQRVMYKSVTKMYKKNSH
jgi:hypothetical protein